MNLKTSQLLVIILLLFGGIIFCTFFFSRAKDGGKDLNSSNPFLSNEYKAEAELYLQELSFYQKAAQSIIVKMDHLKHGNNKVIKTINAHNPGFILLRNTSTTLLKSLNDSLPKQNNTIFGVQINEAGNLLIDSVPINENYQLLGTLNNDSLIYDVALKNGSMLKALGVNFVYGLPSDFCKSEAKNCFSAKVSDSIGLKPQLFIKGFQDAGIMAMIAPITVDVKDHLENKELISSFIKNNVTGISVKKALLSDTIEEISNLAASYLKDSLQHTGFVVVKADEAKPQTQLIAGPNLLIVERNVASIINNLNKQGAKSKALKKTINNNAYKTVLARINLQKSHGNYHNASMALSNNQFFKQNLREKAIVVVKNKDNQIPIPDLTNKKIATISIGNSKLTPFKKEIDKYGPNPWFHISNTTSKATVNYAFKQLNGYNHVFVCLQNPPIENDSLPNKISSNIMDNLLDLDKKANVVIVLFEQSKLLKNFVEFESVLFVPYTNDENIPAQLAFGAIGGSGKLNVNVDSNFLATSVANKTTSTRLKFAPPSEAGIATTWMKKIDAIAYEAISKKATPGCQVFIALDGKIIHQKSYGYHTYKRKAKVKNTDLYDLASITKIGSTTLTAMHAYENDMLKLSKGLGQYLPEKLEKSSLGKVTMAGALTHNSGLPTWVPAYRYIQCTNDNFGLYDRFYCYQKSEQFSVEVRDSLYLRHDFLDSIWAQIRVSMSLKTPKYKYSDLGPFLAKQALENIFEDTIDNIVNNEFAKPLGLQTYTFNPLKKFDLEEIVPTERNSFDPSELIHGHVHDPVSAVFGGIAGHAGLFSNATDLGIVMQMLLNNGYYGGKQFFKSSVVAKFTNTQPNSHRGIGFNKPSGSGYSAVAKGASSETFGHTGFTGTCAWVDPQHKLVFVFLSNRVHPSASNKKLWKLGIRKRMHQVIYDAIAERDKVNQEIKSIKPIIDTVEFEVDSTIPISHLPYNNVNISY